MALSQVDALPLVTRLHFGYSCIAVFVHMYLLCAHNVISFDVPSYDTFGGEAWESVCFLGKWVSGITGWIRSILVCDVFVLS